MSMSTNMSSNTMSDVPSRSSPRVGFHNPISSELNNSPAEKEATPLREALKLSLEYIATLHIGLTTFLSTLAEQCLKDYAVYFYAHEKNKGMRLDPTQVPTSIKKIRLTLHPLEEVKESEDFMALHTQLVAETEALQRKWTTEYAMVVDTWNCNALRRRCHFSICKKLRNAAKAFIAQTGIQKYSEDAAIIDLISTSRNTILTTPLPLDIREFLYLYKEANELRTLPMPTTSTLNSEIKNIIDEINKTVQTTAAATNDNPPPPPLATVSTIGDDTSTPSSSLTGSGDNTPAHTNTGQRSQQSQVTTSNESDESSSALHPIRTTGTSNTLSTPGAHEHDSEPTLSEVMNTNNAQHVVTPSTGHESQHIPGLLAPATPIPILYRGKFTGYTRTPLQPPTYQPLPTPQGNPPHFSLDPSTTIGVINPSPFTQGDDGELDRTLADIDLDKITATADRTKILTMLATLYTNAIKLPVEKFHTTVTLREELIRIKQVTTIKPISSLATKVAAKIHNELPTERPTLVGLIHNETDKKVSDLKRQLQSAMDQIETNSKRLKSLQKSQRSSPTGNNLPVSRQRQPKNKEGGNWIWSRANNTSQSSPAVADDSLTTNQLQTVPQTQNTREANPRNMLQKHQHQGNHSERSTPVVNNNAEAARRRRRNTQRSKNKLNGKNSN